MPTVEEVFTPARPASEDVFAERTHKRLQQRVEEALTAPGAQLIVYGSTGVGKTSLIRNVCKSLGLARLDVSGGAPFNRLMEDALGQIEPLQSAGSDEVSKLSSEGKASVGVFSGKLGHGSDVTEKKVARRRSLISELLECMQRNNKRVLFIDNFEAAEQQAHYSKTVAKLGELIKAFSDAAETSVAAPVLVVAGIPSSTERLITFDQAVERRTIQLEVPEMNAEELGRIIERGEDQLGVVFDNDVKQQMITLSNGYPYYVHLFALHAVRAALDDPPEGHWLSRKRRHVAEIHLETGLRRAVEDDGLSLSTKYNDAVTSTGKRQARKLALEALARTADVEVDLRTIRQSFLDAHPNDDPRFLGSALRELAERHHLLVRRTRMGSTTQLYRFRDPLMKGYVRTRERLNHT